MKVTVTIGRDGTITAKTHQVTGSKCMDAIPMLEDLLDAEAVASEFTEDYHRTTTQAENQVAQQQSQWNR